MGRLELTQNGESFFRGGIKVPRLTDVLQDFGIVDYSRIPKGVREFALDRGSKVHKMTELFDKGILREETLDSRLVPYLDGWKMAVEKEGLEFTYIEVRMFNQTYFYTTKPDRIGTAAGVPVVIEIKTGAVPWWGGMQCSAQAACFPEGHKYKRIAIGLPGDGSYHLVTFTDPNDRPLILSAITLYNLKQKHNAK
jgi:hypothetical protein